MASFSDDDPLRAPQFSIPQADKEALLPPRLIDLVEHHRARCPPYARLLAATGWSGAAASLADIPHLPVGVFKTHELRSVPEAEVFRVLTSSGTTGQRVSRVFIDKDAASLQTRALSATLARVLGGQRLPMLIVDAPGTVRRADSVNARAAGVLGMMTFGRAHRFALDDAMTPDVPAIEAFLARFGGAPFLIFGFTFMVWAYLREPLRAAGLDLRHGILIHSGGWKKLRDQSVDGATFKARLLDEFGLARVHNFYGMVEQIGSVFLEADDGFLRAPSFADVIVRDPATWAPCPPGQTGVIQVLSTLPRSYPGHSILTEDMGRWYPEDPAASWRGKRLIVEGRAPAAELRGCGDIHAAGRS